MKGGFIYKAVESFITGEWWIEVTSGGGAHRHRISALVRHIGENGDFAKRVAEDLNEKETARRGGIPVTLL